MKARWLKLLAFALPVLIVGMGFALTQVTFQNTSRINTGLNIFITQPDVINPLTCPAHLSTSYINNPSSIFWNVTAGGAPQQEFFCIDNQGSAPDRPSVTSTLGPAGACPSTGSTLVFAPPLGLPMSIPANSATAAPVTISVCAGSNMIPVNPGPTFSVTVT